MLMAGLMSCGEDGPPVSAAITTPARSAAVSGTTAVQVSVPEDAPVDLVRVYVRGEGEDGNGVLLGSANRAPFVVAWNTTTAPNGPGLELYAVATAGNGPEGISDPVPVRVSNPDAPALSYLVTFNLPTIALAPGAQGVRPHPRLASPQDVTIAGTSPEPPARSAAVQALPEAGRDLAVEWGWEPYSGANGYDVFLSTTSRAGPYDLARSQLAVPTGLQKFYKPLPSSVPGRSVYGAVAALTNNALDSSSLSNAGKAEFLPAQQTASPVDGQTVPDGRPILTWPALSGADGYLFFLCDTPCSDLKAVDRWTNFPNGRPGLSAVYPADRPALSTGTYWWWVAGVKVNPQGQVIAFSYSDLHTLTVP